MLILKLLLLISFLIVLCFYVLWKRRKYDKLKQQLGGPSGYPLIGSVLDFRVAKSILYVFERYMQAHGHSYILWVGFRSVAVFTEPEIIKDVLTSPHCINKLKYYDVIEHGIGPGLITAKDPLWSRHRKLLNPAFSHKILLTYLPIFNGTVSALLETVDGFVGKAPMNFTDTLQSLTAIVAKQTATGINLSQVTDIDGEDHKFTHKFRSLADIFAKLICSPWLRNGVLQRLTGIDKQFNELKSYLNEVFKSLIEMRISNQTSADANANVNQIKHPFINRLLELQRTGDISMQDVAHEIETIFLAAFETTSTTLNIVLILLAMFPQYQTNVLEELKSLYPEKGDFEVSYEDAQKLIYLEMVINEAMRLFAAVPLIGRQATSEVPLSNGAALPKDTEILINIFHLQRRKDIWGDDAQTFNPEHFLKSNMEGKHPYAFIPFAKGLRNCIGWRYALLSMKVTLAKLLRNYCFHTDFKFEDLRFVFSVTLKFEEIPLLSVTRRDT